eukprot:4907213-Amphidinium_carterae.1
MQDAGTTIALEDILKVLHGDRLAKKEKVAKLFAAISADLGVWARRVNVPWASHYYPSLRQQSAKGQAVTDAHHEVITISAFLLLALLAFGSRKRTKES